MVTKWRYLQKSSRLENVFWTVILKMIIILLFNQFIMIIRRLQLIWNGDSL